jgi:3-hexulose-6-phosphate synthase/6-phospho-3-hexuloisomerase
LSDVARLGLNVRISVAGGINANTVAQVAESGADIIVVGAAIYGAPSPADAARTIRRIADGKTTHRDMILDKISSVLSTTNDEYYQQLTDMLDGARRIFVSGAGRSGLVGRFFAMRLVHSGYDTSMVGEVVTPSINAGDLLIVISGSGETEQLIAFTKKAQSVGAKILLICSKATSTIGDMADAVFQIGKTEQYGKIVGMPMGTVFELSTLSFLEGAISHIIHEKGIPEEIMRQRHANLE